MILIIYIIFINCKKKKKIYSIIRIIHIKKKKSLGDTFESIHINKLWNACFVKIYHHKFTNYIIPSNNIFFKKNKLDLGIFQLNIFIFSIQFKNLFEK